VLLLTDTRTAGLLQDFERKKARAAQHLSILRKSIEEFANREREPVVGRFDTTEGQYIFDVPLEPIDPEWPLLVGDFAYDMRASLDYLVTALIRSTGSGETDSSNFPIFSIKRVEEWRYAEQRWDRDKNNSIAKSLEGTPPGTKEALKPLQPFHEVPRANPWEHPLFSLQTLNNRDKHRRLNLLAQQAHISFVDPDGRPFFHGPPASTRIPDKAEKDTLTVQLGVQAKFDRDVLLTSTYDVRLHEPLWLVGNLIDTLTEINRFIEARVLPAISGLL
jgi:hypothetical protein